MNKLQQDLQYVDASLSELQEYLLSKELYWSLSGPSSLPRLTLGGLLISIKRLGAHADSQATQLEAIHSKWRSAWEAKSKIEVHARSGLWKNYLADYRGNPKSHVDEYPQQVKYRTMITLLGESSHELDEYVHGVFVPGTFVWEEECAPNFERNLYWFLFGRIK